MQVGNQVARYFGEECVHSPSQVAKLHKILSYVR